MIEHLGIHTGSQKDLLTLLAVSALVLWCPAYALASISISQSIDRADMAFEDTAGFQIVVSWDGPAHAYLFDKPLRLTSDRLKVARFSSTVRTAGGRADEVTTKIFDYKLAPVLSGLGTIESLVIEYVTWPDSLTGQLVTDPVTVAIAEPLPPEKMRENGISAGWLAVIVVGLVGAGVGLFAALKRKTPGPIVRTPAEAFLEQLEAVKQNSGADLKKFQTGLYRSLLSYIGARYDLDLTGRPADHVVTRLQKAEIDPAVCEKLAGWLVRAEKEKFSPLAAPPGEVMRLESEVRDFFEKMKRA